MMCLCAGVLALDRQLLQAPAPAPASGSAGPKQAADGVFTFGAASITFANATSMVLSGLSNRTAYVQYPPRVTAGTIPTVGPSQDNRLR